MHPCSSSAIRAAGSCGQNNTCGGGAFPELQGFQCKGFNPEGADLGTAGRCAANAYDNMGYLTLDFTCSTTVCKADGDCQLVRHLLRMMISVERLRHLCPKNAMQCCALSEQPANDQQHRHNLPAMAGNVVCTSTMARQAS